jgi:hypothetical protein
MFGAVVQWRVRAAAFPKELPMITKTKVSEHRRRPGAEERSEPGVDQ